MKKRYTSKPNMLKRLNRIHRELSATIDNAPPLYTAREKDEAEKAILTCLSRISKLWESTSRAQQRKVYRCELTKDTDIRSLPDIPFYFFIPQSRESFPTITAATLQAIQDIERKIPKAPITDYLEEFNSPTWQYAYDAEYKTFRSYSDGEFNLIVYCIPFPKARGQ